MYLQKIPTLIVFLFCFAAYAEEPPAWITNTPDDDTNYRYYVGRANGTNESELVEVAFDDAKTQAIRDNFGVATSVQSKSHEEVDYLSVTTKTDEISSNILLKGFKQRSLFRSGKDFWVLYSYSKAAIEEEKKRQASPAKDNGALNSISTNKSGDVIIITEPSSVAVFVDDAHFGFTPMRIYKRLSPGHHIIRLERRNFKPVEEPISITPNAVIKIKKELKPDEPAEEASNTKDRGGHVPSVLQLF